MSGNPTTTALTLADALRAGGAALAYRGDFDWPGTAIADRMTGRYDARPWRMTAADYEQHVANPLFLDGGSWAAPGAGMLRDTVAHMQLRRRAAGLPR